ncbi:MAG: alpha/beta fold hydrolase [Candidatus Zixiibacteriota bacterium]
MTRILVVVAVLSQAMATTCATTPATTPPTTEERMVVLDDSLKLWANLMQDTAQTKEPLVVLLHMLGRNHESYQPFIDALLRSAATDSLHRSLPTILNLDLRGHGRSGARGLSSLSYQSMAEAEFRKIPGDVKAMVEHLKLDTALKVDWDNITVVGASIGANSAALLSQMMPQVKRIVLLSPGLSYRSLEPLDAVRKFTGKILIYASKGDEYSRKSSEELAEANKAHAVLRWFGANQHGTDIINEDRAAMDELVRWVMSN